MADHPANMADNPVQGEKIPSNELPVPESEAPHKMSVGTYVATRFSSLKPPMNKAPNPIRLLMMLNTKQWLFFFVGFFAWVRGPGDRSRILNAN
jgi:SHS family lactate transporter-like MFS transporter